MKKEVSPSSLMKIILAIVIPILAMVVLIGSTYDPYFGEHPWSETDGRGYSRIVDDSTLATVVDTNVANNRDSFYTRVINSSQVKVFMGYFAVDTLDTNYKRDSAYVRLITSHNPAYSDLQRIIKSDSFAIGTRKTIFYSYVDDTLFWEYTWWELIVADSTSDSLNGGDAPLIRKLHKYIIKADYTIKPK